MKKKPAAKKAAKMAAKADPTPPTTTPRTQAEVDAAIAAYADGATCIDLTHLDPTATAVARYAQAPWFVAWESSAPRVVAWESSAPRVVARGSSAPRVVAWESSAPRVEARESSAPRVVAWGSSAPRVVAWGSSQLGVIGPVAGTAGPDVAVSIDGDLATIDGGHQVRVKRSTPSEWCAYYGVPVKDGVAVLFKGVDHGFRSGRGFLYVPGTKPEAPDWDGAVRECGGGLHFSPHPSMTLEFFSEATRFVACPVALADIVVHPNGESPQKVKARRVCAPCWEVDEDGERVETPKLSVETAS